MCDCEAANCGDPDTIVGRELRGASGGFGSTRIFLASFSFHDGTRVAHCVWSHWTPTSLIMNRS